MFCKSCGAKIPDDSKFCFRCGDAAVTDAEKAGEAEKISPEKAATPADFSDYSDYSDFSDLSVPGALAAAPEKDSKEAEAERESSYGTAPAAPEASHRAKAKKPRLGLVLGLAGGITLFFLALSLILTVTALAKREQPFYDLQMEFPAENSNEIGNTPANSLCFGIAALQDDTIYHLHEAMDVDMDMLKAVDLNGNNERVFFTFDGDISNINVIGDDLFFVGDSYDADYTLVSCGIYRYDLHSDVLEEIYTAKDTIFNLYVLADQLYFNVSTESGGEKIVKANLNGTQTRTILKKEDYIYSFAVFGDFIYYVYQDSLCRCDLNGQQETELYTASDTLDSYCVAADVIYVADRPTVGRPVIKQLTLDGEAEKELLFLSEYTEVWYLNVVADTIYYIEVNADENGETLNSKICSVYADGEGKQTLVSSKEIYYGLSLCGPWLFSYDNDKMKTVKINISNTPNNKI